MILEMFQRWQAWWSCKKHLNMISMLEKEILELSETLQQERKDRENLQMKMNDIEETNYILKAQVCMGI